MTERPTGEAPRTEAESFYDPGNFDGPSYNAGFEDGVLQGQRKAAAAPEGRSNVATSLDVERLWAQVGVAVGERIWQIADVPPGLAHRTAREVFDLIVARLSPSSGESEPGWLRELRSKVARYENAEARAKELVRGSPVDWSTDAAAQEPGGWWKYTSQNNRDVLMAAVAALGASSGESEPHVVAEDIRPDGWRSAGASSGESGSPGEPE